MIEGQERCTKMEVPFQIIEIKNTMKLGLEAFFLT